MTTQIEIQPTHDLARGVIRPIKMQKPKKFRSIFVELKESLNGKASDHFIAESAARLVDLYDNKRSNPKVIRARPARVKLTPGERFEAVVKPGGKTVSRSKNIDMWNLEGRALDLRWIAYADLDFQKDDDLSLEARARLNYLIGDY
jgi:hypothetical protein